MSWTVSKLQRPFRENFSLEISGIIAEKESQIFGRRFVGFDRPKKARPFSISKRALAAASETAGRRRPLRPYFFTTGGSLTWTPKTQAVSSATLKKSVFPCTEQALEPCRWREISCLSFGTAHPSAASPARAACSIGERMRTRPGRGCPISRRGHRRENAGVYDRYDSRSAAQSQRTGWRLPYPR